MSSTLLAISQSLFKMKIPLYHSTSTAPLMAKIVRINSSNLISHSAHMKSCHLRCADFSLSMSYFEESSMRMLSFLKNPNISYNYNYLSDLEPIEIPPEKPGKEPPISPPSPSPSPDFPGPPNPLPPGPDMPGPPPEIVPPGGPDVIPPTGPEIVPPGWPDVTPPTPPEIVPPTGPDVVPPNGPEPEPEPWQVPHPEIPPPIYF